MDGIYRKEMVKKPLQKCLETDALNRNEMEATA